MTPSIVHRLIVAFGFAAVFFLVLSVTDAPRGGNVLPIELTMEERLMREIALLAPPPALPDNPRAPIIDEIPSLTPPEKRSPDTPASTKPTTTLSPPPHPANQVAEQQPEKTNTVSFADINTKTRESLVNIYCSTKAGGAIHPFTGSGTIIDPRGIVLTNAHIGQFFLIKDYPATESITCTLRTGSPARETYTAELLYLPSRWIAEHAADIVKDNPVGTGEHDFALLHITGTVGSNTLPESFPYTPFFASDVVEEHAPVLVAGYPAELVGSIATLRDLYITSTVSAIGKIYTFAATTADLVSVGGSPLAQKGASGGAVVDERGRIVGVVATATDGASTAERDLRAVTLGHISRSMKVHTGRTLAEFLTNDPAATGSLFRASEAPLLAEELINAIEQTYEVAP